MSKYSNDYSIRSSAGFEGTVNLVEHIINILMTVRLGRDSIFGDVNSRKLTYEN